MAPLQHFSLYHPSMLRVRILAACLLLFVSVRFHISGIFACAVSFSSQLVTQRHVMLLFKVVIAIKSKTNIHQQVTSASSFFILTFFISIYILTRIQCEF
ncbi:CLUMA_CG010398, isoform A [Clunio marinus]|uniref:CLUMA_CG010398, isoform A n=1 Tax=Clunio marinus TaxID=568069 RepID=A0A1J1I9J9_9DIPT|nr:CLUMA_CG010398, isoform A [Clunio marinus]